jgi:hypothetical protein
MSLIGPNKKWPIIRMAAIKYNTNEGQKLASIFTITARIKKRIPRCRRYLITTFKNFILNLFDTKPASFYTKKQMSNIFAEDFPL